MTRTEYDGQVTVLMDRYEGKRLSSPNDVVVKSDDSIWFTDMTAGITGNWNGETGDQEVPMRVYRIDGKSGKATIATADVVIRPNGLAFSPDEIQAVRDREPARRTRDLCLRRDRRGRQACERAQVLIKCQKEETPDGFRVDVDGNLWCGWGMGSDMLDGVRVFNPQGEPTGHIALPERCANVCFGGPKRNRLFMAASHSLYALYVNTQGARGG